MENGKMENQGNSATFADAPIVAGQNRDRHSFSGHKLNSLQLPAIEQVFLDSSQNQIKSKRFE